MTVAEWQGVPRTLIGYALDHERLKEKDDQAKLLLECIETCCKNTNRAWNIRTRPHKQIFKAAKNKTNQAGFEIFKAAQTGKIANKIRLQEKSR